jgi:hypothetical protein
VIAASPMVITSDFVASQKIRRLYTVWANPGRLRIVGGGQRGQLLPLLRREPFRQQPIAFRQPHQQGGTRPPHDARQQLGRRDGHSDNLGAGLCTADAHQREPDGQPGLALSRAERAAGGGCGGAYEHRNSFDCSSSALYNCTHLACKSDDSGNEAEQSAVSLIHSDQ